MSASPRRLRRQARKAESACHGMTIVELLVGMAVGLFIVAAGASLLAGHLRENRSLMLETRLTQDLRTAADLITRDLRRAGYWGAASSGLMTADGVTPAANPYATVEPVDASTDTVSYRYSRDTSENNLVDSNEQFGFRLRNGAIEKQLGAGNWQALTDAGTLRVTGFIVTPHTEIIDLSAFCAQACPAGSLACPPRQSVRSLAVQISGVSASDAALVRNLRSQVRLRNDTVTGACPA